MTEAYKLYCKIKKKQELVKNGVSPESKANNSTCVQNDEDVPIKEVPIKEPEKDPGPSIWGGHLNKIKPNQEIGKSKVTSSTTNSPTYSKLTEKLMKGAKINIRTSLTRKLVNKSISSPVIKLNDSQLNSSQLSEACNSEHNSSLFPSPEEDRPFPAIRDTKKEDSHPVTVTRDSRKEEPDELFQGFKPKIVQHQATHKQPFSLSMARQRIASRQVDLQWLDDCLVEGGCTVPSKPEVVDDQDVIYSTDDEAPKPTKIPTTSSKASQSASDQVTPPPTVKKRKFDPDQVPECSQKRPRIDRSPVLQENGFDQENVLDSLEQNSQETLETKPVKYAAKENSTDAAKRERLVKYLCLQHYLFK